MDKKISRLISVALTVTLLVTSFVSAPMTFAEEAGDSKAEAVETAEPEVAEAETDEEPAEENDASQLSLSAETEGEPDGGTDTDGDADQGDDTEEPVQVDAPGDTEPPVLKIKAQTVTKPYKNKNGHFKVLFTASWNDTDKVKDLQKKGWKIKYSLRDQNNKILKNNIFIKHGVKYKVNRKTKYKIVAVIYKGSSKHKFSPISTKSIGKIKFPAKPVKVKATCPKSGNDVKLTWKKVDNAYAYYVYRTRKKSIPAWPVAKVKKASYKDKNLKGPHTYYYYVRAVYRHTKAPFKYQSSSQLSGKAKVSVNEFLTTEIRPLKWFTTILNSDATLYDKKTGNASHGKVKKGAKVEVLKKYPTRIPRGGHATRIYVKWTDGKKVKKGWISYTAHVRGRVRAQVAYRHGKAIDWSKARKEEYVNKKGFTSKTKYFIWVSTYTQRANIFKGKKGHWKLIKSYRVVSGEFLWWTKIGENFKIWKHAPRRIRYFVGSTTRKYWYHHLSHFQGGNAFHTVCWVYPGTSHQVNVIKENLQPGTKGCLRMYTPDAVWVYDHVPLNTRVVIY